MGHVMVMGDHHDRYPVGRNRATGCPELDDPISAQGEDRDGQGIRHGIRHGDMTRPPKNSGCGCDQNGEVGESWERKLSIASGYVKIAIENGH